MDATPSRLPRMPLKPLPQPSDMPTLANCQVCNGSGRVTALPPRDGYLWICRGCKGVGMVSKGEARRLSEPPKPKGFLGGA